MATPNQAITNARRLAILKAEADAAARVTPQQVRRVASAMGASSSLGDDIPVPRPAPVAPPPPSYTVVLDEAQPQRLVMTPEAAEALMRKIEAEGIDSVPPEQLAALEEFRGDLTGPIDDGLEASAIPITADDVDAPNLTPNKQRVDPITNLAERIRRATTQADTEPAAGLRALMAEVDALPDDDKVALMTHPALAEGIESAAARTPEGRAAAIANAQARLIRLNELASVDTPGRAAEQLDSALRARQIGTATPAGNPAVAASAADAAAARELVGETLQQGDLSALMEAFNALPADRKDEILRRLPGGREVVPRGAGEAAVVTKDGSPGMAMDVRLGNPDPTAPRPLIEKFLDDSTGERVFLPNAASQFMPAGSPLEQAILDLDIAKRSGDPEAIEMARLELQTIPHSPEEAQTAVRWFNQRNAAIDSFRRAMIGTDPMVVEEQGRMLANAAAPAPRPNITPGARSPIVQPLDVPDNELPNAADVANAVERERQARLDKQAPGGFLSEADRLSAFPPRVTAAGEVRDPKLGDLPAAMRGRDGRGSGLESRSAGSRLTDSNDAAAIESAAALNAEISAALADVQAARGGDVAALAKATQRLEAAYRAMDDAFPPRIVNPKTGEVRKISRDAIAAGDVPKGFVVEEGRKAWSDSHINKPGQEETVDNLILTGVGARPKVQAGLTRSSDGLSPVERSVQNEELLEVFGDDAVEFLPGSGTEELVELGGRGKRGRLGGRAQMSRVQAALQTLYTEPKTGRLVNPLALRRADENGNLVPLFPTARDAAEDLLKRSTVLKPGTASHEMALEQWTKNIEEAFGSKSGQPAMTWVENADGGFDMVPALSQETAPKGTPAGDVREGTSLDVDAVPALAGRRNAIDIPEPADATVIVDDEPSPADFPKRGQRPARVPVDDYAPESEPDFTGNPDDVAVELDRRARRPAASKDDAGVSDNLNGSAVEVGDAPPADIDTASKPKPGGRRRSKKEVDDELAQFEQDVRDEWRDSGLDPDEVEQEVRKKVNARRKELESEYGPVTGDTTDAPATDAAPADAPAGAAKRAKRSKGRKKNTADADAVDDAKPADIDGTTADSPPVPEPSPPAPKKSRIGWLGAAAALFGGGTALVGINSALNSLGRRVDLTGTPADGTGGGQTGGPQGMPVGIPPVPTSAMSDDPVVQAAAIQQALDRIRGTRQSSSEPPPYQTFQHYNMWR